MSLDLSACRSSADRAFAARCRTGSDVEGKKGLVNVVETHLFQHELTSILPANWIADISRTQPLLRLKNQLFQSSSPMVISAGHGRSGLSAYAYEHTHNERSDLVARRGASERGHTCNQAVI